MRGLRLRGSVGSAGIVLTALGIGACSALPVAPEDTRIGTVVAETLAARTDVPPPQGTVEPQPAVTEAQPATPSLTTTPVPPEFPLHAEGQETLAFESCFDLDAGAVASPGVAGCDFIVRAAPGGGGAVLEFSPQSPASFDFGSVYPAQPSIEQCRESTGLKGSQETIVPLASMYVCYQTGEGRYGYLSFTTSSESGVTFTWRTFDPAGEMTAVGASQTPTVTSTTLVGDTDLPTREPDYRDRFTIPANWELYENAHVKFDLVDENFILKAFQPDGWDGWILTWPKLDDFYLEATFTTGSACEGLDRYGLVARQTNPDDVYIGYLFGISCDGRYSLRSWEGESGFLYQVPWASSGSIRPGPGQSHRLGFLAEGDRIVLYVDRQRLTEVTDSAHSEGKFGFFVAAKQSENFTVEVEEIAYWKLP